MKSVFIKLRSFVGGIKAMTCKHEKVNYHIGFGFKGFWFHAWTPKWHEGRGPYVTIGLGFITFMRGY